jgi:hypothetical protein
VSYYHLTDVSDRPFWLGGRYATFVAALAGIEAIAAKGVHCGLPRTEIRVRRASTCGFDPVVATVTLRGDADWDTTVASIRGTAEVRS